MNVLDAENDIVATLDAAISGKDIENFPDDPEEYFAKAADTILVRYNNSNYTDAIGNRKKSIIQIREPHFIITILRHSLTTHDGIYATLQEVRQALTGYTVGTTTGGAVATAFLTSTMMRPVNDRFVRELDGFWEYEIEFLFTIPEKKTA